jgi:patatin-related protein
MKEKELRLALVCFGGVSLAIYIHGVSKEILKLSRASKALHFTSDRDDISRKEYLYPNEKITDVVDTEEVYFDILRDLAEHIDIRVIIDTIAGASAGGMNSIFLGRALAHDLNYDGLRDLWIKQSDVSLLTGKNTPPSAITRFFTRPFINHYSKKYLRNLNLSTQVMKKLPYLLNIWNFTPPFDGKHLLGLIYGGLEKMEPQKSSSAPHHSLLPNGHRLELFVTLTDFYGFDNYLPLNDPKYIFEKEHRHKLTFGYYNKSAKSSDKVQSDFKNSDIPSLAFASRATACFPGAFPPAQLKEVDEYLHDKGEWWTGKDKFIAKNFKEYKKSGLDPMMTSFIDGAILNNKPFAQAVKAIFNRPAFRRVDRRIIYIDPNPSFSSIIPDGTPPKMLDTIKGSLSDLPRNEPMHDDLLNIEQHNGRVRTIKTIVESLKPNVAKLVKNIAGEKLELITNEDDMTYWRMLINVKAIKESGFSFESYARLKVRSSIANMSCIIADICGYSTGGTMRRKVFTLLHCWVFQNPFNTEEFFKYLEGSSNTLEENRTGLRSWIKNLSFRPPEAETIPIWAEFLYLFDVRYQKRRVQFLIQELNSHYSDNSEDAHKLDRLKAGFYDALGRIDDETLPKNIDEKLRETIILTFHKLLKIPLSDSDPQKDNWQKLSPAKQELMNVFEALGKSFNLEKTRRACDQLIAEQNRHKWGGNTAHDLMISYLGFAFWDGVSFSIMGSNDLGEFNEILVNRISPNDLSILKKTKDEMPLRGADMNNFGAFFNQADRENDYLWGRLNGAERLIDMLNNQILSENTDVNFDVVAAKKRAFKAILKTETENLTKIPDVIEDINERIENL